MPSLRDPTAMAGFVRMFFLPSKRQPPGGQEAGPELPMTQPLTPEGPGEQRLAMVASLLKTGRQNTALLMIERACREQPGRAEFHNSRALVLKACHRDAEALAAFDRVLDLQPEYQEAFYNRQRMLGLVRSRV